VALTKFFGGADEKKKSCLCIDKDGETVQGTSFSPAKKSKGRLDLILLTHECYLMIVPWLLSYEKEKATL
jgi:hypothetical protein